jgi:hypothetical protein
MSFQRRGLAILAGTLCGAISLWGTDATLFGQSFSSGPSGWSPSRSAVNRDAGNRDAGNSDDDDDDAQPPRQSPFARPATPNTASQSAAVAARPVDAPRAGSSAPIPWYQQNPQQRAANGRSPTPAQGPSFSQPGPNYPPTGANYSAIPNYSQGRVSRTDAMGDASAPTRPAGAVRRTAYQDNSYYTPQNSAGGPTSVQRVSRAPVPASSGPMDSQPHMAAGPMSSGEEVPPMMSSHMGTESPPSDGEWMGQESSCGAEGCSSGHCSSGECGGGCCPLCGLLCSWWQEDWDRDLSVSAGVQSFKSPLDAQFDPLAGHFGFEEGLNWGTPIWDAIGLGGQIGVNFVESDLTNEESAENEHRDQFFFTAGFFHRACGDCGLQGGLVYDYLNDTHIPEVQHATMGQLRGDLSYVVGCHELGFDFATNLKNYTAAETFNDGEFTTTALYRPVDTYTVHYTLRTCNGNEAKFWAGYANGLGGIVGANFDIPLENHLSLDTSFMNVIPGGKTTGELQRTESWALGIALVWHPGCCARESNCSPYRPLFNVADNSNFIVNERFSTTTNTIDE